MVYLCKLSITFTSTVLPSSRCRAQLPAVLLGLPQNRRWQNVAVLLEYAAGSMSDPLEDWKKMSPIYKSARIHAILVHAMSGRLNRAQGD